MEVSQDFLVNIIDGIVDPVFVKDRQHRWVLLNDAFCRFIGHQRDELIGRSDFDFFPEHEAWVFWDKDEVVFTSGEENINEEEITDSNGIKHTIVTKKSLYNDTTGKSFIVGIIRDITEQKLAQESINRREQEFRTLAENSPDVIVRYDTDCRRTYANPAWSKFNSIPTEDVVGKSPLEHSGLIAPQAAEYQEKLREVIASSQPTELNLTLLDAHGQHIYFDMHAVPEFDADGNVVSVLTVARDITERKQMEEQLGAREREFSSLAENLPDNIARWDVTGRILYSNPTHQQALGKPVGELIGKTHGEAFPDGRYTSVDEVIVRTVETGEETLLVRQPVPVENSVSRIHDIKLVPEFDEAGRVVSVLGIGRDMTDIYRMQEAVAAREQEFRSLAESSPDAIIRYDLEHRILYLNSNLVKILGLASADEVIGRRPSEVWPDGRFAMIDEAAKRAIASGSPETVELMKEPEPGLIMIDQIHVVPERNTNGEIIGTIAFGRDITAIREGERRLKHFVENLPGMAFGLRISPDGHACFSYVSPGIEEFYGLVPEDVKGGMESLHALAHPDDRPRIKAAIAESMETMRPFHIDYRVCRPGQPERWLSARSTAIPTHEKDGCNVWYGIMLDITERKQMEAELKEQADFQQTLLNALCDVGMQLMVTENGRIIYVGNREVAREFGYSDDDLEAQPLLAEIIHPDDRDRVMDYYRARLTGEAIYNSYELGLVMRNGERREYETAVAIVPGTDPIQIVTIGKDITERKLADAERRRLAEVLEETVDFVGWADMEGKLHYHNRAARQMIGLPEDADLSNMHLSDMHPEWALNMIEEVAMPVVLEDGVWRGESALLSRDGREIPVSQLIMLHLDTNGKPAYTSTIMQDISERKATEFVRETALMEANRLAQMRGAFLSQMSHELRTPLNGILGCAQLLQMDENMDEEQNLWINTIRSSGEYLLMLINDILDYAKYEANKIEIHAEDTELDTLLTTIIGIIRINAEQKNLEFKFVADTKLPSVINCDGLRLRQVLLNLLSNAVKFTDRGQVSLCVHFQSPGLLRFEVQDSGIGISEADIENIFQPYTQVGEVRRHAAGTGLGLAISQQLVRLMGSDIKVESKLGHGSIFSFELNMEVVQPGPMELVPLQTEGEPKTTAVPLLQMPVPPFHILETLHALALRGNMRNIVMFTNHLTEIDSSYFSFGEHVRRMAKAYESKSIVDFVVKHMEEISIHE